MENDAPAAGRAGGKERKEEISLLVPEGMAHDPKRPRLLLAMDIFDRVLVRSLNDVTSDMNRTMYFVFNKMCFCYVRWRRHFRAQMLKEEREDIDARKAITMEQSGSREPLSVKDKLAAARSKMRMATLMALMRRGPPAPRLAAPSPSQAAPTPRRTPAKPQSPKDGNRRTSAANEKSTSPRRASAATEKAKLTKRVSTMATKPKTFSS